ncbi:DUF2254 domain-containing protein [Nocardioides coralli]|uniref:DUF2254 domain-containing protein n=1 Tax=Nocardioides coralli TaxID=2872154 RepID=UPI001CA3E1AC|nr:DUF2254 domain-containing protein [Nocardioides coralli]QZY27647.1 DUF2254 domain-containing protein [Nocardioides coralli]
MPPAARTLSNRVRSSLFLVPMLCVLGGVVLAQVLLLVDEWAIDLDARLGATVDSARTVLTTVAGATLAFAGVAFSVSLLVISMASNQYSPRVVHGLFRDPFNKRVMGLVIGTFTYCLVVLRAVRSPAEQGVSPVVPSISIWVALVLGIVSVLAIVGFINHSAHSMDASQILHRVTREALDQVRRAWPEEGPEAPATLSGPLTPDPGSGDVTAVRSRGDGWVQHVDHHGILAALPRGGAAVLRTAAGYYALRSSILCELWVPGDRPDETVTDAVRDAVTVGRTRTLDQDVSHGVRQLVDVALRGMSPGVNDPTTAHDALCHAATVLTELLRRVPPSSVLTGEDGRELRLPLATTHEELVAVAFDEVRLASADHPVTLVRIMDLIAQVLRALDDLERPEAERALHRQAALVRELGERAAALDADRQLVRETHDRHFGSPASQ